MKKGGELSTVAPSRVVDTTSGVESTTVVNLNSTTSLKQPMSRASSSAKSDLELETSPFLVKEVSFWNEAQDDTHTVARRNIYIVGFFYIPLFCFFIGTHYLAKYLSVDPPKAWMRREPSKTNMVIYYSVVAGFTTVLSIITLLTIYKHRNKPVILSKLSSFILHVSFCLCVIPPLTYVTNILTITYTPKNNYVRAIQALELFCMGQIWAALSNRVAIMYSVLAKGTCKPSYKPYILKSILMSLVVMVVPFIFAMTVNFPTHTNIIKWCAVVYVAITLIEMAIYTVKMRGGFVKLFVDYEACVRLMVMQSILLAISISLFHGEKHGRAFYRFNSSMVMVWMLIFEMFGALVWNEFAGFCGLNQLCISKNKMIGQAYDLIDPRGRLDLLMQDEELYPLLLATARRRYMDENFRFMKEVRQLNSLVAADKVKAKNKKAISKLTLEVLDKYITKGATQPVNLPSKILRPLRAEREDIRTSSTPSEVERKIQSLLWLAYSEIALLIYQSSVLSLFSKNNEVCAIVKGRIDRLNTLIGTKSRLITPPLKADASALNGGSACHSICDITPVISENTEDSMPHVRT